jgi:hypothetical protein
VQALQSSYVQQPYFERFSRFRSGYQLAQSYGMKLDFMICLSILLAILFVGVVGAFLLYVPALNVFTAVTLLLGLGLMFALGILTGRRSRRQSPFTHRAAPIRTANLYVVR